MGGAGSRHCESAVGTLRGVPTFCRHGRLEANCSICSKTDAPARTVTRPPRAVRTRTTGPRAAKANAMQVRRVERAPDDGYDNELAQGLRATSDAARLADELAFSEARLAELREDPPGRYADVARSGDPEEAARRAFEIAVAGDPALIDAYRAWAERSGGGIAGLVGDADWDPTRRFARTFERLTLPGLGRRPRFEFLVSLGALGVVALEAGTLAVGSDATDPVVLAAKRVTGIGDAITIERRLADLARGTGVSLAALDLALYNWAASEDERETMEARRTADPQRRAQIAAALGAS